jgi:sirohydrochlorin ferrochelatase
MGHPCGVASPRTILCDNGSLNPAATLRLRQLAAALSNRLGRPVDPVSVLHSDKVDPALLKGDKAETFETYARRAKAEGIDALEIFPLFIGPSLAVTEYLPERAAAVGITLVTRPVLAAPGREEACCDLLLDNLRATGWTNGSGTVLLCDHGSPLPAVAAVREDLAARLRRRLGLRADELIGCAMERRAGPDYAFNEPMLADAIRGASGKAVILMLFLLPGRHAGAGGDVARLCAENAPAGLSWTVSPLLGDHPGLMGLHILP